VAATGLRKVGAMLITQSADSRPPHTSLLGNSPGRMSRVKMREDRLTVLGERAFMVIDG
jgi:hypothetical protein